MKPLIIQMQAFGPFGAQQVVDFRLLGNKTFFLIHGPTGSGKTTILDAMCFALFGDASGGEREGRQMRSHHADAETLTEVTFDFELADKRYRVRRVPEQARKSRRGGGDTTQLQVAEFFRVELDGDQEVTRAIESGWSKVTDAVQKLIGFESSQFRQVIMLPQGKFFEFLKSSSQEREKILQSLFGTEIYQRIEEQLRSMAADVSQQAATSSTRRKTLLDHAQVEDEAALDARFAQQLADRTLTEARSTASRFDELDKAAQALALLQSRQADWADRRARLDKARLAATIQPYAAALDELTRDLASETARAQALSQEASAAVAASSLASKVLEAASNRAPELEQATVQLAKLEALEGKVTALDGSKTELANATSELTRTQAAQTRAEAALRSATDIHSKLTLDVQSRKVHAAGLDGLRANQARLAAQLAQVAALETANAELAKAKGLCTRQSAAVDVARQALATARQQKDHTHSAWVAGQAARLAKDLAAGHACPVCGSAEHPALAHADGTWVSDEALAEAEQALAAADKVLRTKESALADLQKTQFGHEARITQIQSAQVGASVSTEELKLQSAAATALFNSAETAAAELPKLQTQFDQAAAGMATADVSAKAAGTQATQAAAEHQRVAAVLKEREAGIPPELSDAARLQAARTVATSARDAIKQAMDSATAAASLAGTEVTRVQALKQSSDQGVTKLTAQQAIKSEELTDKLAAACFEDLTAFTAAHLDEALVAQEAADIQAFDANLQAAVQRQERAGIDTRELVRPDVAALLALQEAARDAHLAASNGVRDAVAAHGATKTSVESLSKLAQEYQALEARYALVKKVTDVATGANANRMSFQRYVLATLLEEVLVATTLRLTVMSRGRYEIRRKLLATDQRSAAGLDLEVFDQYTGSTRAVSTLSGGESFLASLALALGLSDVVQSYAGGIRLDAIFVDEGFGTLDSEALDCALLALQDLQKAGRMVGIISHVAELRERIDARLELKAGRSGSVAQFVV